MTLSPTATVTLEWRLPHHAEALCVVMCDTSLHEFVDTVHRPATVEALHGRIVDNARRRSPDGGQHWLSWVVRDGSAWTTGPCPMEELQ